MLHWCHGTQASNHEGCTGNKGDQPLKPPDPHSKTMCPGVLCLSLTLMKEASDQVRITEMGYFLPSGL